MHYWIVDFLINHITCLVLASTMMKKSFNDNHNTKKKPSYKKEKQQKEKSRANMVPYFVEKNYCSLGEMAGFDTLITTFNHQIFKLVIRVKNIYKR